MEILFTILGILAACIIGIFVCWLIDEFLDTPDKPWWLH